MRPRPTRRRWLADVSAPYNKPTNKTSWSNNKTHLQPKGGELGLGGGGLIRTSLPSAVLQASTLKTNTPSDIYLQRTILKVKGSSCPEAACLSEAARFGGAFLPFGVGNKGFVLAALAACPSGPIFGGGPAAALPTGAGIDFGSRFRTACFHISCTAKIIEGNIQKWTCGNLRGNYIASKETLLGSFSFGKSKSLQVLFCALWISVVGPFLWRCSIWTFGPRPSSSSLSSIWGTQTTTSHSSRAQTRRVTGRVSLACPWHPLTICTHSQKNKHKLWWVRPIKRRLRRVHFRLNFFCVSFGHTAWAKTFYACLFMCPSCMKQKTWSMNPACVQWPHECMCLMSMPHVHASCTCPCASEHAYASCASCSMCLMHVASCVCLMHVSHACASCMASFMCLMSMPHACMCLMIVPNKCALCKKQWYIHIYIYIYIIISFKKQRHETETYIAKYSPICTNQGPNRHKPGTRREWTL